MNALGLASTVDSKTRTGDCAGTIERKPAATARTAVNTPAVESDPTYEAVAHELVQCEDCGGTGIDPGSLHEAEACPACSGYGDVLAPVEVARIARKWAGRSKTIEADEPGIWTPEERVWKVGE